MVINVTATKPSYSRYFYSLRWSQPLRLGGEYVWTGPRLAIPVFWWNSRRLGVGRRRQ
jgi:hypothetical protein